VAQIVAGDNTLIVHYPAITPPDGGTTINLLIVARLAKLTSGNVVFSIDGDTIETRTADSTSDDSDAANQPPDGMLFEYVHAATIDTATEYNTVSVKFTNSVVLSFLAITVPEVTITDANAWYIAPGQFEPGAILKGFDPDNGSNASIDGLIQYQHQITATAGRASVENLTLPCLWGWAAPRGRYAKQPTTAGYMKAMYDSFRPRIFPRNPRALTSDIPVDIVFAYRCDTGCKVRVTAVVSGDSVVVTPTANTTAAPVVHIETAALTVDPAGDELTVELYCTTTAAIELWSMAVFARPNSWA
jgi:hypothetical protein